MEPYSYFLHNQNLVGNNENPDIPLAFSHFFESNDVDLNNIDKDEPLYFSHNGKSLTISLKDSLSYKSYQIHEDNLISSKTLFDCGEYDKKIYDSRRNICFIFKSEVGDDQKSTKIYVSYIRTNEENQWQLYKHAFVLEYEHVFNRYFCFLSSELRKIVILTGHNQYGYRKTMMELCDTHLHVLGYEAQDNSVNVQFNIDHTRNVTDARRCLMGNYFNQSYFTVDGTKLILVSGREQLLVVYSLVNDTFGDVYRWNEPGFNSFFYAYNKLYHDVFVLCNDTTGQVQILIESQLNMLIYEKGCFKMQELGFEVTDKFTFHHVDYYNDVILHAYSKSSHKLVMVNALQKTVINQYSLPDDCRIIKMITNWSGEELFLLLHQENVGYTLKVLYHNKNLSLRDAAKLAVYQACSVDLLRNLNLPKMLKSELYPILYQ